MSRPSRRSAPPPILVNVGIISENSGVYISQKNVVFGVSRHSKENNGFGEIDSQNLVYRNISAVYDNDLMDTIIDDRDTKIYYDFRGGPDGTVTQIGFDTINVATMTQNAGVFVGDVKITGLDSHSKGNSGQGGIEGDHNIEIQNLNYVEDSDAIDAPIFDQDFKVLLR